MIKIFKEVKIIELEIKYNWCEWSQWTILELQYLVWGKKINREIVVNWISKLLKS